MDSRTSSQKTALTSGEADKKSVFVSYPRAEAALVIPLVQELRVATGHFYYVDEDGAMDDTNYVRSIGLAIKDADAFLVFVGSTGLTRWQTTELQLAVVRYNSSTHPFQVLSVVLPSLDEEAPVDPYLTMFAQVRITDEHGISGAAARIAEILGTRHIEERDDSGSIEDPVAYQFDALIAAGKAEESAARFLQGLLRNSGLAVWHNDYLPGERHSTAWGLALARSRCCVLVLGTSHLPWEGQQQEKLIRAMVRALPEGGRPVIPVLAPGAQRTSLEEILGDVEAIDLRGSADKVVAAVRSEAHKHSRAYALGLLLSSNASRVSLVLLCVLSVSLLWQNSSLRTEVSSAEATIQTAREKLDPSLGAPNIQGALEALQPNHGEARDAGTAEDGGHGGGSSSIPLGGRRLRLASSAALIACRRPVQIWAMTETDFCLNRNLAEYAVVGHLGAAMDFVHGEGTCPDWNEYKTMDSSVRCQLFMRSAIKQEVVGMRGDWLLSTTREAKTPAQAINALRESRLSWFQATNPDGTIPFVALEAAFQTMIEDSKVLLEPRNDRPCMVDGVGQCTFKRRRGAEVYFVATTSDAEACRL